ncbi:PAS domain S-box protein [Geothrix oryzisoli]|uniref:PAS domain S-box protein n=1 Tax=Geothrix oryzisoli TaxID=2922721 RepID=UPI001FAB9529|nr:PAS domain S-box protein [Geothrix oryzisoli]
MRLRFPVRSIRGRMLLAAILVEATMLTLLVTNSLRLLLGQMTEQASQHAAQLTPVLNAALIAPLAQRDSATVKAILDECAATQGIAYLAVTDGTGRLVAVSGWDRSNPLPLPDQRFHLFEADGTPQYNVASPVAVAGQNLGTVHFGLDLSQIVAAQKKLLAQGTLIAIGELLLTAGLLALVGFWLTRHLTALTRASEEVAGGNLAPPQVWEGGDDVGRLGVAFNAMSRAIRDRIHELTEARDMQVTLARDIAEAHAQLDEITHTMGDGLYVIDTQGRITFMNPRMEDILGWSQEELLGRSAHDLFHQHQGRGGPALEGCETYRVLQSGQPYRSTGESYWRKDGEVLRVSLAVTPILRKEGIVGAVISFQDVTEIHRSAQALRTSEERLAFAIEGSGDGLWDWDIPSGTVFFSRRWKEMLGYLPHEIGSDLSEWDSRLHPDDRERVSRELREHLDGAAPQYLSEHRVRRKDGSYSWILDRGCVVERDSEGRAVRMIGTHSDITLRKGMERSLEQKDRILEVVSRSVVGLLDSEWWEDGIPAFLAALGNASAADRVYIFRKQAEPRESGEVLMDQVFEWCAEGIPPQIDAPELQGFPMRGRGYGRWLDDLQAHRMISGRVADLPPGERPLLEAQGIQSILVMPIHVRGEWWGLIGFDACGGRRGWPLSEQEVLRLAGRALGAKIERAEIMVELERRVAERTRELDQKNLDLIAEMDTRQDIEASNRAVMIELEQSRKMESIGRLAAGIAHEINTPTQFLGNNLGFLKSAYQRIERLLDAYEAAQGGLPPREAEALAAIAQEVKLPYLKAEMPQAIDESLEGIERVTKIVRAMKEFSHPGGREKASLDVNQCLTTTSTVARNEWKYVAELRLDLDPTIPMIQGLSAELNQAFLNLIVNAADAIGERPRDAHPKGLITVSTRSLAGAVEIRVEDNGVGMDDDTRKKIFEPFFTTKKIGKGSGQGLTVCYQVIVNRHGGTIHCLSQPGTGTSFIIRLPIDVPRHLLAGTGG